MAAGTAEECLRGLLSAAWSVSRSESGVGHEPGGGRVGNAAVEPSWLARSTSNRAAPHSSPRRVRRRNRAAQRSAAIEDSSTNAAGAALQRGRSASTGRLRCGRRAAGGADIPRGRWCPRSAHPGGGRKFEGAQRRGDEVGEAVLLEHREDGRYCTPGGPPG